ncbi:putative lipid phosphate phosphatase 3 [Diplonema papillatum]|nr:putative lipid phosphate phosphatase 3 [Diplonema papillatum]
MDISEPISISDPPHTFVAPASTVSGEQKERWGVFKTVKQHIADSPWLHYTYCFDWIAVGLMWGAATAVSMIVPPCTEFSPSDPLIGLPYHAAEMFPGGIVPVFYLLLPCVLAVCVVGGRKLAVKGDAAVYIPLHDLHHALLTILLAVTLAMLVTASLKNSVGRLRPDFVDRLRLELGYSNDTPAAAAVDLACKSENHVVIEGRRSLPSGHASMMFAGWTALGLFAAARLRASYGGRPPLHVLAALLVLTEFFPALVAASRVIDDRHHFTDVIAGSGIGIFCGLVGFSLQHSFSSSVCLFRFFCTLLPTDVNDSRALKVAIRLAQ